MLRTRSSCCPMRARRSSAGRRTHRVLLITKGDLLDQERKLAQSGLGELFDGVEIVWTRPPRSMREIFARHGDGRGARD